MAAAGYPLRGFAESHKTYALDVVNDHLDYVTQEIKVRCEVLNVEDDDEVIFSYRAPSENPLTYETQLERLAHHRKTMLSLLSRLA